MRCFALALLVASAIGLPNANADIIYQENFDSFANGTGLPGPISNPSTATFTAPNNAWSLDATNAELTSTVDGFRVQNGRLEGRDLDFVGVWLSREISLTNSIAGSVGFSLDAFEIGTFESTDYFDVEYSIDGGDFIKILDFDGKGSSLRTLNDDFGSATVTQAGLSGTDVIQLRVTMRNNADAEILQLDNVQVHAAFAVVPEPSSATLFLCAALTSVCYRRRRSS